MGRHATAYYTPVMPALSFPNPTALRLALANGVIPPAIARATAVCGVDAQGRIWIELTQPLSRETLAALHRLGAQVYGKLPVPGMAVQAWAELLPLTQVAPPAAAEPVLFVVPDRTLATFAARLRRLTRLPADIWLPEGNTSGCVFCSAPPAAILSQAVESGSPIDAFYEQAPRVWAQYGWAHPLPQELVVPSGHFLLVRPPRRITAAVGSSGARAEEEVLLARRKGTAVPGAPRRSVLPVRPYLAPRRVAEKETLWVLNAAQTDLFWRFCAAADERLTRRLEVGVVEHSGEMRLIVRTVGKRPALVLPFSTIGYAADPRLPGLFLPANQILKPTLRPRELAQALGLHSGRIVWLEQAADGSAIAHSAPIGIFRPVAQLLNYTAPASVALSSPAPAEPFPLMRYPSVATEAAQQHSRPALPPHAAPGQAVPTEHEHPARAGWLRRSLGQIASYLMPRRARRVADPPASVPSSQPSAPASAPVERKIASPDALLHGHDWSKRRRELESRLFRELPSLGPADRSERWAELAAVYSATGSAADSAVCWMNAVWESPTPSAASLEQWLAAERRATRLTDQSGGLDRWLGEPTRPGMARVVAAYTAWAGYSSTPPAEFPGALRRILAFLESRFDDLPARAAWLARLAATRLCDGDILGLARWRDRVLARLADLGPGLDLDEPSFLRFHGTASAERFQIAREWLTRVREPAMGWINRHGDAGRLRSAGLDAETEATAAYAQFMLAWGLGCLGERIRSREWASLARQRLPRVPGPGVDPAGHALLADLFQHRIKEAQEGRAPKPGPPGELRSRLEDLPYLARYSVDRLRQHSRILEPLDRVRADRGLQLKTFWGADQLGERLFLLAERADPANVEEEAEALLRHCRENSSTATVPRIVLTLLEVAPWLEPGTFLRVLDRVPTAIDWMEAWLSSGPWTDAERAGQLVHYRGCLLDSRITCACPRRAGDRPPDPPAGRRRRRNAQAAPGRIRTCLPLAPAVAAHERG
jgi:FtsH ternary system-associated peptide